MGYDGPITTALHGCAGDVCLERCLRLQSCKSHQAGMLMHTSGTISSVSGEANKTVSKSQTGDPLAGGKSPPRKSCPRRHRPRHPGRSSTRCLPSTGCQDSALATPPAGASAQRHTSGHRPLKGHERWRGCVGSGIKAPHSSSLPSCRRQRLAGAGRLRAFS